MENITFILDGWDLENDILQFASNLPNWETPTLNQWLRFGTTCPISNTNPILHTFSGSLKQQVLSELNLDKNTPSFLASLVFQHAGMHSVSVIHGDDLNLSWTDAHKIAAILNEFLAEDNWECHIYKPDLWLISYDKNLDWQAPDIWNLNNQIYPHNLITGKDAGKILKILTEIQMLFSSQSQQNFTVNGLWLWQDTQGISQCNLDDTIFIGNTTWLPEHNNRYIVENFSWQDIEKFSQSQKNLVIYSHQAKLALNNGDLEEHKNIVQRFDSEFFAPIAKNLECRKTLQCNIIGSNSIIKINPLSKLRFWKSKKHYNGKI